jgi:hypothetical protein
MSSSDSLSIPTVNKVSANPLSYNWNQWETLQIASGSEGQHTADGCFCPIPDADTVLMVGVFKHPRKPLRFLIEVDFGEGGRYISATHIARSDSMEESVGHRVFLLHRPTQRPTECCSKPHADAVTALEGIMSRMVVAFDLLLCFAVLGCVTEKKGAIEGTWRMVSGTMKTPDTTFSYSQANLFGMKMIVGKQWAIFGQPLGDGDTLADVRTGEN